MVVATQNVRVKDRNFTLFLSAAAIRERVTTLGQSIRKDFDGQRPLLLGVLNGAFIFMADLSRAIAGELEIAFVRYASYEGTTSSGTVKTLLDIPDTVAGRPVIVVEDIVDTGHTMQKITQDLQKKGAASVHLAALLLKPEALQVPIEMDYVGFEIEDRFVVGYGLDYDGHGRQLSGLYAESH